MSDNFQDYKNKIGQYPVLSEEEEKNLAYKISQGDEEARNIFINSNLRLVISIAKSYKGRGIPLMDLIEEGNMGLMTAVDKYNIELGFRFSTYATWWISRSIKKAIYNDSRCIRLPVGVHKKIIACRKATNALQEKLKRDPTLEEIAKEVGMSVSSVDKLYEIAKETKSLNELVGTERKDELQEFIANESTDVKKDVEIASLHDVFEIILSKDRFKEREKEIIRLRFGLDGKGPMSLEDIAKILGITRERVRQIEVKVITKIRQSNDIVSLSAYMPDPQQALENLKIKPVRRTCKRDEKIQSIYEIEKRCSKEELNNIIESLDQTDKDLIRLRYGSNLENPVTTNMTPEERNDFYNKVIPKIRRRAKALKKRQEAHNEQNQDVITKNNEKNVDSVIKKDIRNLDTNSKQSKNLFSLASIEDEILEKRRSEYEHYINNDNSDENSPKSNSEEKIFVKRKYI